MQELRHYQVCPVLVSTTPQMSLPHYLRRKSYFDFFMKWEVAVAALPVKRGITGSIELILGVS